MIGRGGPQVGRVARLPAKFRREQLLRSGFVERIALGVAAQKDADAAAGVDVVGERLPGGGRERRRIDEADGVEVGERRVVELGERAGVAAKFDRSTPAGEAGREGFAEEERVVRPLAEEQNLARVADFDGEVADVVAVERVVADDVHVTLVRAERQAGERKLDRCGLARGGGAHDLLAAVLRAAAGFDGVQLDGQICCASRQSPVAEQFGVDLQEAAGREFLIRQPQGAEREIVRPFDADVDDVDARAGQFVEPRFEGGQRIGRPVGAGQIGEHVDFAAVVGLQLEPIDGVAERIFERADDGAGVEPLDAELGGALVRLAATVAAWPDR